MEGAGLGLAMNWEAIETDAFARFDTGGPGLNHPSFAGLGHALICGWRAPSR